MLRAKTGTNQGYRDAWFIGFTAHYVTGVWFGNDDFSEMNKVTGGLLPAGAWNVLCDDSRLAWQVAADVPLTSVPTMSDCAGLSRPPIELAIESTTTCS